MLFQLDLQYNFHVIGVSHLSPKNKLDIRLTKSSIMEFDINWSINIGG